MRICAISDLHGNLPKSLPECDIVVIAGDIAGSGNGVQQLEWYDSYFRIWLKSLDVPVVGVAGNHDWSPYEYPERFARLRLPWTYLQDSGTEFQGLRLWGSPWQRKFFDWSFNLTESELMGKWNLIPDNTDILICHSPPKFYGDQDDKGEFCGSESLTWRIGQVKPKIMIFGHIHSGRGIYKSGDTVLVNAAMVNENYKPVYEPFVIEV